MYVNDDKLLCFTHFNYGNKKYQVVDTLVAVEGYKGDSSSADVTTYNASVLNARTGDAAKKIILQIWGGTPARETLKEMLRNVNEDHSAVLVLVNALWKPKSEFHRTLLCAMICSYTIRRSFNGQ
jgi:hypothetical protein